MKKSMFWMEVGRWYWGMSGWLNDDGSDEQIHRCVVYMLSIFHLSVLCSWWMYENNIILLYGCLVSLHICFALCSAMCVLYICMPGEWCGSVWLAVFIRNTIKFLLKNFKLENGKMKNKISFISKSMIIINFSHFATPLALLNAPSVWEYVLCGYYMYFLSWPLLNSFHYRHRHEGKSQW